MTTQLAKALNRARLEDGKLRAIRHDLAGRLAAKGQSINDYYTNEELDEFDDATLARGGRPTTKNADGVRQRDENLAQACREADEKMDEGQIYEDAIEFVAAKFAANGRDLATDGTSGLDSLHKMMCGGDTSGSTSRATPLA